MGRLIVVDWTRIRPRNGKDFRYSDLICANRGGPAFRDVYRSGCGVVACGLHDFIFRLHGQWVRGLTSSHAVSQSAEARPSIEAKSLSSLFGLDSHGANMDFIRLRGRGG